MKKMVLMITVILMCIMIVSSAMTEENLSINLKEATDEDLVRAIDIIKAEQRSRLKTKIVLDPSEITLAKGTTSKITASVIELPEDVTAGKFTWGSNDPGIATCSNGSVKGIDSGTTRISCSTILSDGTEVTAECEVTVVILVQSIRITSNNLEIMATESFVPEIIVMPDNATNQAVTYMSSDETIVRPGDNGSLYAVSAGKATITATTTDGSNKSVKFTVTVTRKIGKYEDEIRFQDLEWGSDGSECVEKLQNSGFMGYEKNFIPLVWPRPDMLIWPKDELQFNMLAWVKRPDQSYGYGSVYIITFDMHKTLGGIEAEGSRLVFLIGKNENGEYDSSVHRLIGYWTNIGANDKDKLAVFKTMLTKLEERYGAFTTYISKNIMKGKNKSDALTEFIKTRDNPIYFEKSSSNDSLGNNITCILHGKNNTGIMLLYDNGTYGSENLILYYGKTDTEDEFRAISDYIEAQKERKEDGGV